MLTFIGFLPQSAVSLTSVFTDIERIWQSLTHVFIWCRSANTLLMFIRVMGR